MDYYFDIIRRVRTEYKLQQIDEEWAEFLSIAHSVAPKLIVEIGAFKGGSAACFAELSPSVVSIDEWQGRFDVDKLKQRCAYELISENSHNQVCKDRLNKVLSGRKIDVLFIDGDHSEKGAMEDFYYYRQLVRVGGIIGLHDIKESDYHKRQFCNVHRLWARIQREYPGAIEIKRGTMDWGGIGVVRV